MAKKQKKSKKKQDKEKKAKKTRDIAKKTDDEELQKIVRIAGTDIHGSYDIEIGLRKIEGINFMFANAIRKVLGFEKNKKIAHLTKQDLEKINEIIDNPKKFGIPVHMHNRRKDYDTGEDKHLVSSDLELSKSFDIKREMKIKSYRGFRHSTGRPVRGQRTKAGYTRPPRRKSRRGSVMGVKRKKVQPVKKKESKK